MVAAVLVVPESLVNAMPLLLGLWIGRVKAVLCCGLRHFEALVVCQSAFRTRSIISVTKSWTQRITCQCSICPYHNNSTQVSRSRGSFRNFVKGGTENHWGVTIHQLINSKGGQNPVKEGQMPPYDPPPPQMKPWLVWCSV